jgi:putative heavy-metal chelation protein
VIGTQVWKENDDEKIWSHLTMWREKCNGGRLIPIHMIHIPSREDGIFLKKRGYSLLKGKNAMSDLLEYLRQNMRERSQSYPDDDFIIRGLWNMQGAFRLNEHERTFAIPILLAQTQGLGFCSCLADGHVSLTDFIGKDARLIEHVSRPVEIALLDAIFASFPATPQSTVVLNGSIHEKAVQRAKLVVNEVLEQIHRVDNHKPRVVNVGAVGNFIRELLQAGLCVKATDLEPTLIGTSLHGVQVQGGESTLPFIAESDVALVTGMTLMTNTLQDIINTAKQSGTKLVMFTLTGAHFAEVYCNAFGIDAVVSEPFPFYSFPGSSLLQVYRKSTSTAEVHPISS